MVAPKPKTLVKYKFLKSKKMCLKKVSKSGEYSTAVLVLIFCSLSKNDLRKSVRFKTGKLKSVSNVSGHFSFFVDIVQYYYSPSYFFDIIFIAR